MHHIIGLFIIGNLLRCGTCLPNLQAIKIPEVEILSPGEVNNIGNEQQKRSISSHPLSMNDVDATVKEVQDLIKANPNLPRLTRGEILDILENITKVDIAKTKSMYNRRDPKAIMVVMPYTPSNPNDDRNIEDLYTKPPITQIIGSEPFISKQNSIQNKNKPQRKPYVTNNNGVQGNGEVNKYFQNTRTESNDSPTQATVKPKFQAVKTTTPAKPIPIQTSTASNVQETTAKHHARYSTLITSFEKTTGKPLSLSTRRYHHRRRPVVTTEQTDTPATTYRPRTRRPTRRRSIPTSITTPSTTLTTSTVPTTKYPNHRYPDESSELSYETYSQHYVPNNGLTVISPPNLVLPADINSGFYDLAMQENKHEQSYLTRKPPTNYEHRLSTTEKPLKTSTSSVIPTKVGLAEEINIPEHLYPVVKDMKLEPSLIDIPENYHKKYEITTHSPSLEERKKIQALLESIGGTSTTQPAPTTLIPDVSDVADTLSPDMRDLLMSFGLIPNPNEELEKATEKNTPYVPEKAEVDPASFVGFKPLPDDGESRDEMESLLASFGLGRSYRREKSLKRDKNNDRHNELNFDAVPDSYKHVLKDIGFQEKSRRIDVNPSQNSFAKSQYKRENDKNDEEYATSEEIKKLEKLMSTIKYLDSLNRTVTDQDVKAVDTSALKELIESLNTENKVVPLDEQAAPNPVNYDNGINKNEVKRQELKLEGNITIVTPSADSETSVVSETSEESRTPSIEDLADSFGGKTSTTTTTEEPTTTTKRTGFYYLVDWNTFLDIDDQKGKRVNLRFQPTIGNPKNFLAVNVP